MSEGKTLAYIEALRADFPALHQNVNDKPLIYLDNAATAQKPWQVIECLRHYYEFDNANVHRGIHTLSDRATRAYEGTRAKVQQFINAAQKEEIIFTRGATESINMVSHCCGEQIVSENDVILLSELEHHSNIVPWQMLAEKTGAHIRWIPALDDGTLDLEALPTLLDERVRIVAFNAISNAIGTINPVKKIIAMVRQKTAAPILVDACQVPAHLPLDVQDWDCDFCAFSAHKMMGPTGTGVLYGKAKWLDQMQVWQGGGDMIKTVRYDGFTANVPPYKFEAGTPNIAGVIAMGAAIDYLNSLDRAQLVSHEDNLLKLTTDALSTIKKIRIIGQAPNKASVISFVTQDSDLHPNDLAVFLDKYGIAVRSGHHCAMPLLAKWQLPATARASFAFYNTAEEALSFAKQLEYIIHRFG